MTDPIAPIKNPARVPFASQVYDPVGTAGAIVETAQERTVMASEFKFNNQTGGFEAPADGVYERQADTPADRVRIQLRKGAAVSEADAKVFKRVGPWPGETDEAEVEGRVTEARAMNAPANKAAPAPENKSQ